MSIIFTKIRLISLSVFFNTSLSPPSLKTCNFLGVSRINFFLFQLPHLKSTKKLTLIIFLILTETPCILLRKSCGFIDKNLQLTKTKSELEKPFNVDSVSVLKLPTPLNNIQESLTKYSVFT